MNWGRLRSSGNENVFKGSQLVSSILERHQNNFRSRAAALKFCRQLFRDGVIRGVFGADTFEDSVQLYTWQDPDGSKMTSYPERNTRPPRYGLSSADVTLTKRDLQRQRVPIKTGEEPSKRSPVKQNMYSPDMNSYFKDLESDIENHDDRIHKHTNSPQFSTTLNLQRASTASSESSVDILSHSYQRHKEKQHQNKQPFAMPVVSQSRDHDAIPEEVPEDHVMEQVATSTEYDGSSSIPRSVTTDSSNPAHEMDSSSTQRRWQDFQNSYSDNEKQLIEQMKRMKKEHSHILRTYEDRINKLMAKMHELRSIAEMLENSSTKSSPYGMINSKPGLLNFLGQRSETDRKSGPASYSDSEQPPPLPPRPGRANRLNPNKPEIRTGANMKPLPWLRIILKDDGAEEASTIWHTMAEPQIDPEEVERLFSTPESSPTDGATLYDDLIIRRGRSRQQLVSIYDTERSKRIVICMRCLRATLNDVISAVSSLDTSQMNHDGLAELIELLSSARDIEKILYHVRKKGAGYLDHPEYLVFELSKVDHFKDRLEFIRFRYKTQWHLFEIDQQLRELHTACNEISSSMSLKNLLETLLAVGNYMNSATDMGQADGFGLDVMNKLKETQDRDGKGTLLEFVLKTYCQIYENEVDIGCPTRFRLPEPSNMRHAALVSFEGISDALSNLHSDLKQSREKLLDPTINKDVMRPMDSFRVTAENFFAAALEVIGDQARALMDTRDVFDKTVAYFMVQDRDMTPQQFFHIWAVFLHDCKYYWKLAHRRITKERFELEFKYKGQMSSSSLQGGYGSFSAGVLSSTGPSDPKTSTQGRRVNKWMKSLEDPNRPTVPPKPARAKMKDPSIDETTPRSASPKPFTSTPPNTSEVHKPLPKAAVASYPLPNGYVPNYENQSECDRYLAKQAKVNTSSPDSGQGRNAHYQDHESTKPGSKEKKSSQQFSLKAWLKREREQVRKGVECENSESSNDPKPHGSSKSFTKLKNSMIQRFSGGSSTKKHDPSPKRPREGRDVISPQRADRYDVREPLPSYDVLRNNYVNQTPSQNETLPQYESQEATQVDSLGFEYKTTISDAVISPIDDPDNEEQSPSMPNGHVDHVINKATAHVLPTHHGSDAAERSDLNNNDTANAFKSPVNTAAHWRRTESGQVNGFNHSNKNTVEYPYQGASEQDMAVKSPGAESKCVRGQPVPVYKAKIINNYENQGKFENIAAVRQHAEPVGTQTGSRDAHYEHQSPYARFQQSRMKENGNVTPERPSSKDSITKSQVEQSPGSRTGRTQIEQSPGSYNRYERRGDGRSKKSETPRKRLILENQNYITPGNRVPMNVQSIGSLIDKFDRYNNNNNTDHGGKTQPSSQAQLPNGHAFPPKPDDVPETPRRSEIKGEQEETSPPLPPRSKHMSPNSDNPNPQPEDSAVPPSSFSYKSPPSRLQKHVSPYTRLDNLTMNFSSPQSAYSSPPLSSSRLMDDSSNNNNASTSHTPPTQPQYSGRSYQNRPNDVDSGNQNDYLQQSGNSGSSSGYHGGGSSGYNGYTPSYNAYHSPGYCDAAAEKDEGYRAQLRKAANNSAFDRYGKSPQYTGRSSLGSSYQSPAVTGYGSTAVVKPTVHNNEEVSYMAI